MQYLYTFIALDLAESRAREAHQARFADSFRVARPSIVRRVLAQVLAAVTRVTATVTRRLDARVADDLGRALAPGK